MTELCAAEYSLGAKTELPEDGRVWGVLLRCGEAIGGGYQLSTLSGWVVSVEFARALALIVANRPVDTPS